MHPHSGEDVLYTIEEKMRLMDMAARDLISRLGHDLEFGVGPTPQEADRAMSRAKHRLESVEAAMHIVDVLGNPKYFSTPWIQRPENAFLREKASYPRDWVERHPELPLH